MSDTQPTTTEPTPPPDPKDGIYFEGEELPPARQHGPVPEDPTARPDNRDRRGRALPSHDERYQWPQHQAYERTRNQPCLPGECLPGEMGEYISAPAPAESEPPAEESGSPAMADR